MNEEVRSVTAAQLKSGVRAQSGRKLVLVVAGIARTTPAGTASEDGPAAAGSTPGGPLEEVAGTPGPAASAAQDPKAGGASSLASGNSSPATEPEQKDQQKPEPVLKAARFLSDVEHGEHAQMEVLVEHGDGHRVRFVVEREAAGEWKELASTEAPVAAGKANAKVVLNHPAHAAGNPFADGDQAIRFRCELLPRTG